MTTKHKTFLDNVADPMRDILRANLRKHWAEWNKQGIKEIVGQFV